MLTWGKICILRLVIKMNRKVTGLFNRKFLLFPLFLIWVIVLTAVYYPINKIKEENDIRQREAQNAKQKEGVLGARTPAIYISGGDYGYNSGGMIALASTDEPAVQIGGYNISGKAEISVYEANEDTLLNYLTHDKDGKQSKKITADKLKPVTTIKQDINTNSYEGSKVVLPLKEMGIWLLRVKMGETTADSFVIRSSIAALTKEGDDEFIFWGQDLKSRRSLTDSMVILYSLQDNRRELIRAPFDSVGIAKTKLTEEADIALIAHQKDRAIVPINLKYLNTGYSYKQFTPKTKQTRYFIFTDRPLYKPGDTVYFKAVLRDDDDARYTVEEGEATAKIYNGYYYEGSTGNPPLFEKKYPISPDGTIYGEYALPANAKTGYHTLDINVPNRQQHDNYYYSEWSSNTISFQVEYFRKPEYSIDIETDQTEFTAGDKATFKINGTYFSGQPLIGQKVRYTVYSSDYYEYEYLADRQYIAQELDNNYRYGYWYGNNKVLEGTAILNNNGEAEVTLDTRTSFNNGKSQVFSIEATIDDGSQEPSFARRNLLVYAGEYGIYRTSSTYGTIVNTPLSLPVSLLPYRKSIDTSGINLTAKVHRSNWIAYQEKNKNYQSYRKEDEELPQLKAQTDSQGNAKFSFTPTKIGSYDITLQGKDERGNTISKMFYSYVSSEDQPYYSGQENNELTLTTDKLKYQPGDTVRFNIFSTTPNRDVLLSMERGRLDRYKVVRLNGKKGTAEIPLESTDIPNMYASAMSFSSTDLDSGTVKIPISTDEKKMIINIAPDNKAYGPGETVTLNLSTTNVEGKPIQAEVAFWAVDKAIFELSDNNLGDIFDTFWKERYDSTSWAHSLEGIYVNNAERGGCFSRETKILMGDGTSKNIENIKPGDTVLTRTEKDPKLIKAKVRSLYSAKENGYIILNGDLKITADHILRVNGLWKEAGSIQTGDLLTNEQGKEIPVESIEWLRGNFDVYNLEIEKYHSFFAGGVWVHNQKGGGRTTFNDTAYWNPSIRSDESGKAQISFKLPDNLTTWTLAAVGATRDTRVGQATNEIVVTKDVIVRPILPNIMRAGDEVTLSALVQNFTQSDQVFDVDLSFDSGVTEQSQYSNITLHSNETRQFYWEVKPNKENEKAKLIFSAKSKNDNNLADIVTKEIPVRPVGFFEQRAQTGDGSTKIPVKLFPDSNNTKSTVTLSLSPTILGTLPSAMKYLVNYPYGCIEQTTSRFVPAVIAKANSGLFSSALEGRDIDDMIKKGLERLAVHQQDDGGWAWWYSGRSDQFITAYVIEYVLEAKNSGIEVDEDLLNKARGYLEKNTYYESQTQGEKVLSREENVARIYALTLFGEKGKAQKLTNLEKLSPDILSMAVMANYLNGDKNPDSNGLTRLTAMAKHQGESAYWEGGNKLNFASKDSSTALAIRAIVLAQGDRDLAVKGAKYLTRNRKANYWSNTFATAQVIRAITDLANTGSELSPNYSYTVLLDDKEITRGTVINSTQQIQDIELPTKDIKPTGSIISITKTGDGQLYSTLLVNEFHTDRNSKAADHGLKVTRDYINDKGRQYSLAVGDTVTVNITVSGLKTNENYGVIADELPAGLIPINRTLKNQQNGNDPYYSYYYSYDVSDRDITENGIVLSLYQIAQGVRTYSYQARVISAGVFTAPPASASLMYAPEIYGRSDAQTIEITNQSKIIPIEAVDQGGSDVIPVTQPPQMYFGRTKGQESASVRNYFDENPTNVLFVIVVLLLAGYGFYQLEKRGITLRHIINYFSMVKDPNSEKMTDDDRSDSLSKKTKKNDK